MLNQIGKFPKSRIRVTKGINDLANSFSSKLLKKKQIGSCQREFKVRETDNSWGTNFKKTSDLGKGVQMFALKFWHELFKIK